MKIAVVHDWLVSYAGAERVLEEILKLYPQAELYSLIDFIPEGERAFLLNKRVKTSLLQHFPFAKERYRQYLPLMPLAIYLLDLRGYEVVLSSSHAVAKGVRTGKRSLHICYCHTPMRYAWDLREHYLKVSGLSSGLKGILAKLVLEFMRKWDYRTSQRVHYFIANSKYIAERIKRAYGRDSYVIYPPVDVERFRLRVKKEDFYLTVSRLVPYKRVDLIVSAFAEMPDKRLVVIGDGPEIKKLLALAKGNVEFLGSQPSAVVEEYMAKAKAFIFAAEEDFGIAPVEAQACGTPVIAYGKGGVLETVIENKTGIFFWEQRVESLIEAVKSFEKRENAFDCLEIRKNAERFSKDRFRREYKAFVEAKVEEFFSKRK